MSLKTPQKKFTTGWRSELDNRTALAQVMRERYLEFTDDLEALTASLMPSGVWWSGFYGWSIGWRNKSGRLPRGKSLMWADGRRPLTLYKVFSVS